MGELTKLLGTMRQLLTVMRCFDINNFYFILFYFSDFIGFCFIFIFIFLLDDKETCDIAVTWCDVIGL